MLGLIIPNSAPLSADFYWLTNGQWRRSTDIVEEQKSKQARALKYCGAFLFCQRGYEKDENHTLFIVVP